MSISLLRKLLMKEAVKDTASSSGIMSINKNIVSKVEKQLQRYINDAMKQGVDLDTLSPEQLKMIVQMNKPKPPRVFSGQEAIDQLNKLFLKRGEIIDFPQKRNFKQEIDDMIKDGTITKGARGMKKSKKVQDREMFKEANERFNQTDIVADSVARITSMEPVAALKEANKVIKREGIYKNLNKDQSQAILKGTDDWIHQRDPADRYDYNKNRPFRDDPNFDPDDPDYNPDDYATGGRAGFKGVAGLLGERPGYRSAGFISGRTKSSRSKSKSSTSKGPAGGASAGGNYGGNVNPQQTYAGRTLSQRPSNYGGTGPSTSRGGGGPPGTNTGGGTTTTTTTAPPSFRELMKQKQILDYLNSLEEEDLALGVGPVPSVLGTIFKEGVKGVKPKIGKKGLELEYLKEMDPYGNSLKFNLGTEYKDLLKGNLKPKLELKGTKGNLEYGFGMDKDKNINFGIKMPFGNRPKSKSRNFKDRFAPDISKFNFEDMTGITSQAPTNMQMAKVYGAPELTEFGATPGMFKDTAKFNDMEKYQEIANKQFKMGKEPNAIRDSIKIGSSLYGIDMDNIPKDFLETKEDFKNQKILGDIEFAEGGIARQNFKMGRRAFLNLMGGVGAGIAGLKSGLIGTGGKEATKKAVTETVKSAGNYPPPYFFKLVEKIKFMGDDITEKAATKDREIVKKYKDFEMSEDLGTGEIVIKKRNEGSFYDQDGIISDEYIVYKPGQADEATKMRTVDEYDEYTVRPDADGKLRDSEDGLDSIDEILEEVGDPDSMTLKKADGGRIGFSGGKLATFLADKTITGSSRKFLEKVFGKGSLNEMIKRDPDMHRGLLEVVEMFRKRDKEGLKMYMQKFLPHMDDETVEAFIKGDAVDAAGQGKYGLDNIQGQLIRLGSGRDYAGKIEALKRLQRNRTLKDLDVTDEMKRKPNASGGIARMLGE